MAKVVGGFASSHTPLMYMEGKDWGKRGEQDRRNRELVKMPEGKRVTYDELEALADPAIKKQINEETFIRKENSIQKGLDEADKGQWIEHERVVAWIESWGKPDELPPPEPHR